MRYVVLCFGTLSRGRLFFFMPAVGRGEIGLYPAGLLLRLVALLLRL